MDQRIKVRHAAGDYEIIIEPGFLAKTGGQFLGRGLQGPVGVITNNTINDLYGETLRESLKSFGFQTRTILMPDGESYKSLATAEQVLTALIDQGLERGSTIVSLGGGVVGDLAGFVAAVLYRGIPVAHVPTSLLAMVDSSVGGKTAVNHARGKNLIGAFHQPALVIIDPLVLKSLGPRDMVAGFAEMLKMGAIKDADYLRDLGNDVESLLSLSDSTRVSEAIQRSCALKAEVVEKDERETDHRRILNFGHTVGHAIEQTSNYGTFRHGEAVLLGMYAAGWISQELQYLSPTEWSEFAGILKQVPFSGDVNGLDPAGIETATHLDKKVEKNRVNFVLLKGLGETVITDRVQPDLILQAVEEIKQFWNS